MDINLTPTLDQVKHLKQSVNDMLQRKDLCKEERLHLYKMLGKISEMESLLIGFPFVAPKEHRLMRNKEKCLKLIVIDPSIKYPTTRISVCSGSMARYAV